MRKALFYLILIFTFSLQSQNYQFLGPYTADGTPLYFATNDTVSQETLDLVASSLPENYPVPVYNPQYISSGYDTDLIIDETAEVWVTFVSEGAGYKNVLGFYTYDLNNPPVTPPTDSDITIVFPNVSGAGSGGSLLAGNKVKIGNFPAGTGIGWVLLANGWNGSQVTNGLWRLFSNPSFNPEADPNLQYHNVLLNDPDNERILLGFEDIRRDNSGCDNDFNDAIFYVTANPYTAIRTVNVADVSSRANITSANEGGLESEGSLATLIAKRNFNRIKKQKFANKKQLQRPFVKDTVTYGLNKTNLLNLNTLFPATGMFGTETAFVSSPTDLIQITNAEEVFSIDYYDGNYRVAAALGTKTSGEVYNHSKVICDRLNDSELEDIRTISLNGYEIIMSKLKRINGEVEFALHFSIETLANENKIHSYWNINQYPSGDYNNFQIWGSSMGQVAHIAYAILNAYLQEGTLSQDNVSHRIPKLFVKKGVYKDGKIKLTLINKAGASSLQFEGNKKETELSLETNFSMNIPISTSYESEIEITTGSLFDIGFTILGNNDIQDDALYLADGPWGIDYIDTETTINTFQLTSSTSVSSSEIYVVERNATVVGEVKGTANLFRNILPGELFFDASNFDALQFSILNTLPVELVLVTENTSDWNERLRYQLNPNSNYTEIVISFQDFYSPNGNSFNNERIKGIVFSVIGNYNQFQPFELHVSELKLTNNTVLSNSSFPELSRTVYAYPNPFSDQTTLVLPETASEATLTLLDITGRIVYQKKQKVSDKKIIFTNAFQVRGIYTILIIDDLYRAYKVRCVIK
ncbi:DUF4114 domain-containing protein [Flavobacterium sp. J27]|uniref:DUF4114 domain-containing protein n=1 Tax=Flavobacterium sp. J27 TaxID=2060419 RepID=UPI00103107B6|nr:DUF4114 domain-containing protein [Flavobacterium sp. J27]